MIDTPPASLCWGSVAMFPVIVMVSFMSHPLRIGDHPRVASVPECPSGTDASIRMLLRTSRHPAAATDWGQRRADAAAVEERRAMRAGGATPLERMSEVAHIFESGEEQP